MHTFLRGKQDKPPPHVHSMPSPPLPQDVREARACTRAFQQAMKDVLRRLTTTAPPPPGSLAGFLLEVQDPGKPGRGLSAERLCSEFSNIFVAGADTSGSTLAWALVSMGPWLAALRGLVEPRPDSVALACSVSCHAQSPPAHPANPTRLNCATRGACSTW